MIGSPNGNISPKSVADQFMASCPSFCRVALSVYCDWTNVIYGIQVSNETDHPCYVHSASEGEIRLEGHQRAKHLSPLPLHIMTARGGPPVNFILMHNLMIILQLNCPRCILVRARFKCPRRSPLTFPLLYNLLIININIPQCLL